MLSKEEKKAIERIEDFLSSNVIISISSDESANSEELKAFISKNEYLAIEFISSMFLKQSKEIEELKETLKQTQNSWYEDTKIINKIKVKIEEVKEEKEHYLEMNDEYNAQICNCIIEDYESLLERSNINV